MPLLLNIFLLFVYLTDIYIFVSDVPQVPSNFTGYSYASGYINLTWVAGFDGGREQHFILSKKDRFGWQEVANLSDPGQGRVVHYKSGHLNAGQEYLYELKSCNIINCSKALSQVKITFKGKMGIHCTANDVLLQVVDIVISSTTYSMN